MGLKKTSVAKPGEIFKLSTDYNRKLKAANKIKNKCLKKKVGKRHKSNKISEDLLKTDDYLDTKDQDKINYMFLPPKKEDKNNIPGAAGHFVRTEIYSTDFKKENLASKVRRNKTKKPYLDLKKWQPEVEDKTAETINILQDIATLQPGKNAQITAKKISEKYKKMREALTKKKKYKLPGEIVRVEDVKTDQGTINVPVSIEKPKRSGKETAKNIIKRYDKIRREKKFKKVVETNDKKKNNENISILEEIKNANDKKNAKITAQKIFKKYKRMKIPKKHNS